MWFRFRALRNSFRYAAKGFSHAYRNEQNFRIQLVIAVLVVALMFVLRVKAWEAVALIFVIIAVLVLELLNTVLERFIDVLKPRMNDYSKVIKDMMAAVVLISSLGAIVVGVIIFYPYILGN